MSNQELHELDCVISNRILAVEKVKDESEYGSTEYVIAMSKEIAYMECLTEIRRYL